MKYLHSFKNFLNENLDNRYKIYKKQIEWKQHPTKGESYSAKVKQSNLEILSTGYGNWELRIDGKPIMPSETAKEKTAEDNAVKWYDWDRDKVGALMHTAQEMFESVLHESKLPQDKDHEITQAGNIWVLVYKIKNKTFKHHFGSEKEAEEFWNSKKENLRESKTENVINEDYRNTDTSLKEYVGKTVKAILEDDDGENSYVTIQFKDNTQMKITAYPLGSGGVGVVVESLNEKIEYPEGVKTTGDKILDKLAKLLNSSKGIIEVGSGSVRGKKVPFQTGDAYFNITSQSDTYVLLCSNGDFEFPKKEIKDAEVLFNQIEKAVQMGTVTIGKKK